MQGGFLGFFSLSEGSIFGVGDGGVGREGFRTWKAADGIPGIGNGMGKGIEMRKSLVWLPGDEAGFLLLTIPVHYGSAVCLPHLLQAVFLDGWHLHFIPRTWGPFNTLRFSLYPVCCADFMESVMFSWLLLLWVFLISSMMVILEVPGGRGHIIVCRLSVPEGRSCVFPLRLEAPSLSFSNLV